jgi:hypothetical protein
MFRDRLRRRAALGLKFTLPQLLQSGWFPNGFAFAEEADDAALMKRFG